MKPKGFYCSVEAGYYRNPYIQGINVPDFSAHPLAAVQAGRAREMRNRTSGSSPDIMVAFSQVVLATHHIDGPMQDNFLSAEPFIGKVLMRYSEALA